MPFVTLKVLLALATGFVGGYVHQSLGLQWGLALLVGYGLGFWLFGTLK